MPEKSVERRDCRGSGIRARRGGQRDEESTGYSWNWLLLSRRGEGGGAEFQQVRAAGMECQEANMTKVRNLDDEALA
eukprot:6208389-Pleurochrysis_carterae.AAC.1